MIDFEETIERTKEALTMEVERLNELKERELDESVDRNDLALIQEAINSMGEAFQSLDMIF